jgi:hypothetical protein
MIDSSHNLRERLTSYPGLAAALSELRLRRLPGFCPWDSPPCPWDFSPVALPREAGSPAVQAPHFSLYTVPSSNVNPRP